MLRLALGVALLVTSPAAPCVIGDPGAPPAIAISTSPPDCCYGSPAGTLAGTVTNADTDSVQVVVYVEADVHYRQTGAGGAPIQCPGGGFATQVYGGCRYSAVLARRTWDPPAELIALPPVGGDILGVASSLDSAPHPPRGFLLWDHPWLVKSFCGEPTGPGMNRFADDSTNVSVAGDTLRLRLTNRGGEWYSSEIYSAGYVGYGMLQFQVEGRIDLLDPNLVASGFIYSDRYTTDLDELDIEFARWGDPGAPNAQFAVQPDSVRRFIMALTGRRSTHTILWLPDRVEFASRQGGLGEPGAPIASWTFTGAEAIPSPDFERVRVNLWHLENRGPANGLPAEFAVSGFRFLPATGIEDAPRAAAGLRLFGPVPNPSAGRVVWGLDLPAPALARARLYDASGRLAARLLERHLAAGPHSFAFAPAALPSGVYTLRADAGGAAATRKLAILR